MTLAGGANGATLQATAPLTIPNEISLNGLATLAGSTLNFTAPAILSGNSVLVVNNTTTTFADPIVGTGALTIAGTGTTALTAPNSYRGHHGQWRHRDAFGGRRGTHLFGQRDSQHRGHLAPG